MMILMCKKYDIPINYKDLGIIQDDTEQDEDSLWGTYWTRIKSL